jgi:spore maturation protein CgeB
VNRRPLDIVVAGLSITSSWGNGHATTYRGLLRALAERGHRVTFLERDVPWYAENRDLPRPAYCELMLYGSLDDLAARGQTIVRDADVVIVGSYVPDGIAVGDWVHDTARGLTAFYDIDTPVTLAALDRADCAYLAERQIAKYGLYLSFTGGPTLARLEQQYGSPAARALYCSFDPSAYFPERTKRRWDLGYMGTYSVDRQPVLDRLLVEPARTLPHARFVVAGPMYPAEIEWPSNVERTSHLAPADHRAFYNAQRFTLNVTRADMVRAGYSPSVRLFEAAACGTAIISDPWAGLETLFEPGREVLLAQSADDVVSILRGTSERDRTLIGERARRRVLAEHTADHRADELERTVREQIGRGAGRRSRRVGSRVRTSQPGDASG